MEEVKDIEHEKYKIQKITTNPEMPKEIEKAINENKFIIFIGAGVSRLVGCISWNELACRLIEECYKKKDEKEKRLIDYRERELLLQLNDAKKQITIAKNILKNDDFYRIMEESLKINKNKNNVYEYIKELNGVCITTNADKALDEYYEEKNIKYRDKDFNANGISKIYLYKIHGTIDKKDSLVFTVAQYLERYSPNEKENKNFLNFLERVFSEYTILFVGYGISEFELLDYIVLKSKSLGKKSHYTLNGYFSNEEKILQCDEKYYETLGIKVIPFLKDELGFNQLTEILKKWSEKISIRSINSEVVNQMEEILENPNLENIKILRLNLKIFDYKEKFYYKIRNLKNIKKEIREIILTNGIIFNNKIGDLIEKKEWIELEVVRNIILNNLEQIDIKKLENILNELEESQKYILENNVINYRTNKIILGLILILKENLSEENLRFFSKEILIEQSWSILFVDLANTILPYLIKNRESKKLEQIFIKLLEYNKNYYNKAFVTGDIIYEEIFSKYSFDIFSICSLELIEYLIGLTKKVYQEDKYIFYKYFIPHINNEKLKYSIGGSLLVKLLYQSLNIKINCHKTKKILKELLDSSIEIFNRIALKVIIENKKIRDLLFEKEDLEKLFDNNLEELEEYLEKYSNNFTEKQIELVVNAIEKSFNDEESRDKALYRKSWLNKLKSNNNKINELIKKYNKINSNDDIEFKNEEIEVGWKENEYISPITKEQLKNYLQNNDFEKIINLCKEFENKKDTYFEQKPSKEGILEVFKDISSQNINLIIDSLNELKPINEEYIYYILTGIQECKKIDLEQIKILLKFISNKIKEDEIWKENKIGYSLKRKISEILHFIFSNLINTNENIEEYLLEIYNIIKEILEKLPEEKTEERDIILFGLNSYKGKYLELLIKINLKLKEIKSKEKGKVLKYTQKYLEKNILIDDNISYIVGLYIRSLKYLDENWIEKNKNKFFNKEDKEIFWKTMGAYLLSNFNLYNELYKFMQQEYKDAIDIIKFGEEKYVFQLTDHLLIGYIHYKDNTILKLIEKDSKKLIEKIIRFIEYYNRKINQNRLKRIWKFILNFTKNKDYKENIYIQSIGLFSKVNSISKEIIEIVEDISKNISPNTLLNDMFLDWLENEIKNSKLKEEDLKVIWIVIEKFTEKGILFVNCFDLETIKNFIKILYENNLEEEGKKLRDDYISKGFLL